MVALGAAIHANSLVASSDQSCLLDVTPLSLRLGIAGQMTETIIDRNSPIPIDHTRIFTTAKDNQESVAVRIYQGESREAEGNTALGEFQFSGYEPGPRGQVQIEVTFAISTEGIVKVSARDPRTGAAHSATVSMSSGLSEEELRAIVAQARTQDVRSSGPAVQTGPTAPRSAPSAGPAPSMDDAEEFLELPPIESEPPTAAAPASPAASSVFGEINEDLALPDEAETPATANLGEEPGPEFDVDADIGDLSDASLTEAAAELVPSEEPVLGEAEAGEVVLDQELKK